MIEFVRTRSIKQWLAAGGWAFVVLIIAADYVRQDRTLLGVSVALGNGTAFILAAMAAYKKWF
jgi:hypothetical protein